MDTKTQQKLGNKIKIAREKAKLTQEEVAEKTGITTTYVAMIERGEANLAYDKIRKIFNLLKMKSSDLPL